MVPHRGTRRYDAAEATEEDAPDGCHEPGKIRNVAVVGHRGTGKTSLVEAMLFQAGATNRLGTIEAGTTVSDWDEDEQQAADVARRDDLPRSSGRAARST